MVDTLTDADHQYFMKKALALAEEAGKRGDLPIGSIIVHNHKIISADSNRIHTKDSIVSHAEINAIHSCAPYLKRFNKECVIYTTVEPCMMCLPTIVTANICHVFFAVTDHYMNMEPFIKNNPYIKNRLLTYQGGILENESAALLKQYARSTYDMIIK